MILFKDTAYVVTGSTLGLLLTENLHSNPKLFANGTSLFSTVADEALSNSYLNDDLKKKKMIGLISRKWILILTVQNPPMKFSSVEKKYSLNTHDFVF